MGEEAAAGLALFGAVKNLGGPVAQSPDAMVGSRRARDQATVYLESVRSEPA
jgi:hypothetical protein